MCLVVAGCAALGGHALLARLPNRAAGVDFSQANVIDDSFLTGHGVDDVYAGLGRSRRDGSAASRLDPASGDEVGALIANGVPGDQLFDAFTRHWRSAAVVGRTLGAIGDRSVWVLEHRGGDTTVVYRRNETVFYAYSAAGRARDYIPDMP